jgi:hypothetical protein
MVRVFTLLVNDAGLRRQLGSYNIRNALDERLSRSLDEDNIDSPGL